MPLLKALLEIPTLSLTLRCGHADVSFGAVHDLRVERERTWLSEGDLRLAEAPFEGVGSRPDPRFMGKPSVLGLALIPTHRTLSHKLVQRAEHAGLSLFTVPPSVSLARVKEVALHLLAHEAAPTLRAASSLQSYLSGALSSPKPERELLERLHALTGLSYVLLSPWGSVLARAGRERWAGLGSSLEGLREGRYRLGGQRALLLRVEAEGRLRSVLVVLGGDEGLALAEPARAVLHLTALQRDLEAQRQEVASGALLETWLAGAVEVADLGPRLAQVGFEPGGPVTLAVCEVGYDLRRARAQRRRQGALYALKGAGTGFLGTLGLPSLAASRGDHLLWVFQGAAPGGQLEAFSGALRAATPEDFRLGLSLPHDLHESLAGAYRQAVMAAQSVATARGGARFTQLDPVRWLLERQPPAHLRALRDGLLGPVKAADPTGKLYRTLQRYLRAPSDLTSLAAELHIHVNTLRYRLNKIEALIGQPLSRPDTLAKLYLAEQIDAMLERP